MNNSVDPAGSAGPQSTSETGIAGLDLGPGPRPEHADEWERRLRDGVQSMLAEAGPEIGRLWGQVRIEVRPAPGGDLQHLRIDATGLQATQRGLEKAGALARPTFPPAAEAEPITLHRVDLLAAPAHLDDVPIDARAELQALQALLVRADDGHLWILTDPQRSLAQLQGQGTVTIRTEDLETLAHRAVARQLEDMGATLSSLRVRVRAEHERALAVLADAKVRRRRLSATVQIRMDAHVDEQMVAHIGQVQARAGNPVVAMVLAAVRGKLDRYAGRTFDLNAHMPAGLRLVDLGVETGDDFVARARFA